MRNRHCKCNKKKPLNVIEQCGDCCYMRRQFTLDQSYDFDEVTTETVYGTGGYQPACIPGQSEVEESATAFPFGTLLVSNTGTNPFDFEVVQADIDDVFNATVFPGAHVAYSGVIREVNVTAPPDPVRALFQFDLFFLPPDPIAPVDSI